MAMLYIFQRRILFLPDKNIESPQAYNLQGYEDIMAVASDGESIQLWYKKASPGYPTILYFHGNAANLANRAASFAAFSDKGFGVLALSYRGYGRSTGSPTERGIYRDARAALAYLIYELNVPIQQILFYGESLGSGVAVHLATEQAPAAIVLEAPYTSVANRAAEIYFYIPVHLLIKDHFNSYKKIEKVKCPLLILHGAKDATIPIAHGKALLEAANDPKKGIFFEHVGHNDFDRNVISAHVLDFATEHRLIQP
jgi:fermentation-respiration switch protein FrsA (DUF1100 family)